MCPPQIRNPAAKLKLNLLIPTFFESEHPYSMDWHEEPELCHLIWQLFHPPYEHLAFTSAQIQRLQEIGLLLPPQELPLYALQRPSSETEKARISPYQLAAHAEQLVFNFQAHLNLVLHTPLRGQPLLSHAFNVSLHASVCALIWDFFYHQKLHWTAEEHRLLLKYGLYCPPEQVSQPVAYLPRLDRADALVPYPDRLNPLPEGLKLNPYIVWQTEESLPDVLTRPDIALPTLPSKRPLLWVKVPHNQIWTAYAPDAEQQSLLQQLDQDQSSVTELSAYLRRQFFDAGLLISPEEKPYADLPKQLATEQFCVIPKLLNPAQLAGCRHYLRALETQGLLHYGDGMVKHRLWRHNEVLMRFFQHQFSSVISEITQQSLKPSYCYLAIYHSGAHLARHTDRKQCAWNLSLVLDMQPTREQAEAWPIYLETPQGVQEVRLEMGDGLLYQGDRYPHWRPPLPLGHKVGVCFFHFVEADFKGLLN